MDNRLSLRALGPCEKGHRSLAPKGGSALYTEGEPPLRFAALLSGA